MLLTKSIDWSYEEEWRIIKPLSESASSPSDSIYLFDLPAEAIEGIILGAATSDDLRSRIIDLLVGAPQLNHVWLKEAHLQQASYALEMVTLPIHRKLYPLLHDLQVTYLGEENDKIGTELVQAVVAITHTLQKNCYNFNRLKKIHIVEDIEAAAEAVFNNLESPYTQDIIVLGCQVKSGIDVELYLREGAVSLLTASECREHSEAITACVHGLLKVHDFINRWEMFGEKAFLIECCDQRQYIAHFPQKIWTEYLVHFEFPPGDLVLHMSEALHNASSVLTRTSSAITKAISAYRAHGDIDKLLKKVLPSIEADLLLGAKLVALQHSQSIPRLDIGLDRHKSLVAGLEMNLIGIHKYYPGWEDLSVFDGLLETIEAYLLTFGLCFDVTEEETLYLAVLP